MRARRDSRAGVYVCTRAHCYRVTHPGTLHPVRVRYELDRIHPSAVQLRYFPIFRFGTHEGSSIPRRASERSQTVGARDIAIPNSLPLFYFLFFIFLLFDLHLCGIIKKIVRVDLSGIPIPYSAILKSNVIIHIYRGKNY